MSTDRETPPSFSPRRRLKGALHAIVGVLSVAALVVMANYLADRHAGRWFLSSQTELRLSPQTLGFLRPLTNAITVTVFYDRDEPFFSTVQGLLKEYRFADPHLTLNLVDYIREPGAAQQVIATYKDQLAGMTNKNLVIFECERRVKIVPGDALTDYLLEPVDGPNPREFRRKPVAFRGEQMFTAALLAVTTSAPLKACFLTGHDELAADSTEELQGYSKFASLLQRNYIQVRSLSLAGTNTVPEDCHLLIIPGPLKPIPAAELDKLGQYLNQGGRLLALFNNSRGPALECGLEPLLAKWGVAVSTNIVTDLRNTTARGYDLLTTDFAAHAAVHPLRQAALKGQAVLHLIRPRAVARQAATAPSPDAAVVEEIVRSADAATLENASPARPGVFPLIVAVEKGAVRGVVTERGTTRMIVAGDAVFLGNQMIASASNQDFAAYAVNWLLDRSQLLHGLGPRPVSEFRLVVSQAQLETLQWLLLGGMPGAVLLLGGLVWLRRRK